MPQFMFSRDRLHPCFLVETSLLSSSFNFLEFYVWKVEGICQLTWVVIISAQRHVNIPSACIVYRCSRMGDVGTLHFSYK